MSKLMRASTVVYMAIVVFFWGYLSVVVFESSGTFWTKEGNISGLSESFMIVAEDFWIVFGGVELFWEV